MLRVCKTLQRSEPQDSIVFLILGELLILDLCRPKHPQYKRLKPTPSLFANGLLFLLAIIISAGAFKDYKTRSDPRSNFRIMEWRDEVLDDPVFPEISVCGKGVVTLQKLLKGTLIGKYTGKIIMGPLKELLLSSRP